MRYDNFYKNLNNKSQNIFK